MESDEFRKQVKDTLEHLHDTAYLQVHPLLSQITSTATSDRLTRAQKLRGLLQDTLETLRPQAGTPASSPEWRSYLALRYHYVQGMSMAQTESKLGISLRQLQRELHKGLDALSQLLWDRRMTDTMAVAPSIEPVSNELQELESELSQWEFARQPSEVKTLVQDALWMLTPTPEQQALTVQVDLPAHLPPVLIDSTLTRQALFKVIRLMARPSSPVLLQASPRQWHVDLILQGQQVEIPPDTQDWQMAELLISQQGGALAIHESPAGSRQVVLSLPRANQTCVLVIDDNQAIHRLFERYLAPYQYKVIHAYSGQEALRLAVEASPHLITLDVMLPNMDGWQILRDLTQNPATKNIPVVVCSVLQEPELAFSMGARAYLKKPVERVELVTTLARLCSPASPSTAAPLPAPGGS